MSKKFLLIIFIIFAFVYWESTYSYNLQNSISNKVIRLHVIANSDSNFDQALKLEVRDKTVDFLSPLLSECKNIDESRFVIQKNLNNIEDIAIETLAKCSDYSASAELTDSRFPTKKYSNYSFPAGEYETLKITIGEGKGQNWWCVMFPPLCFTDSAIEFPEDSVETLSENLSQEEFELISNADKPKIKIKFKLLEWMNR